MKSFSKKYIQFLFTAGLACTLTTNVLAESSPTACYQFSLPDGPEASALISAHPQIWCYKHLNDPANALFIYNADENKVKPELAILIETNGTMTHGSLLAGKVGIHKLQGSAFNPFPVPLEEPFRLQSLTLPTAESLEQSIREVLDLFLARSEPTFNLAVGEGNFKARANSLPWRGFWWPYKGLAMRTPLSKYDRFVAARTGSSPGAAAWEGGRHVSHGLWWEGHCNGWASSAILRAEPRSARKDAQSGVTFSVSDQKGLLAEKDYCSKVAFFGNRNRGRATDNPRDIIPSKFHNTLVYYLGRLNKSVAMDYHADPAVDNHIISAYTMNVEKTGSNSFKVAVTLTVHKYDGFRTNTPATAPTYTRKYRYSLVTDANGNAVGGSWHSANPDFLWVPLSPATCPTNNPRLNGETLDEILNLPASS